MEICGSLEKSDAQATNPITYHLILGQERVCLNDYLGKFISLTYQSVINCIACHVKIKKSYQGGYCFPCTQRLAQCDICIVRPERCHYHKGTCRQPAWGEANCLREHVVYLANSSGLKVGITKQLNVPTRWIDQGAIQAIPLYTVATRRLSGLIEHYLAGFYPDKTNWRALLKGSPEPLDLHKIKQACLAEHHDAIAQQLSEYDEKNWQVHPAEEQTTLNYPVLEYPKKIVSLGFDKQETVEGTLLGIKGQYLILDVGVINMRKHAGYTVCFKGD